MCAHDELFCGIINGCFFANEIFRYSSQTVRRVFQVWIDSSIQSYGMYA